MGWGLRVRCRVWGGFFALIMVKKFKGIEDWVGEYRKTFKEKERV